MSCDIKSVTLTATGAAIGRRCRVVGYDVIGTTGAGSVVLRDGGASGAILLDTATVAATDRSQAFEGGILFDTNCHATLTNITSLTLYYA